MTIILIILVSIITACIVLYNMESKESEKEYEQIIRDTTHKFGQYTVKFIYNKFNVILINTKTDKIQINSRIGKLSDIISSKLEVSESKTNTTYSSKYVVKKDTVNTVGRALVGGAIAGGLGAAIGASTAPSSIKKETTAHTTYTPKSYIIVVKTKDIWKEHRIVVFKQSEAEALNAFINDWIGKTEKAEVKQWIYGENLIKRR